MHNGAMQRTDTQTVAQQTGVTDMTNAQITAIRAAINAAHNSGNTAEADKLQAQLHNHF